MTGPEKAIAGLTTLIGGCSGAALCSVAFGDHPKPLILGAVIGGIAGLITSVLDIVNKR